MSFRAPRTGLSSRFQSAAAFQPYLDAALGAIASGDARKLADSLQIIAENKVVVAPESMWQAAGRHGDAAIFSVLADAHITKRSPRPLFTAAWQGAVIANNTPAMAWLASSDAYIASYEDKAALAGLAVREGHSELARELLAPTTRLGAQLADKKNKLLVNYLHACAANDRHALAIEVLNAHFANGGSVFAPHNDAYHDIVMRAATGGHVQTLQVLLDHGADYLSDQHIGQLMVAALDKNHRECARAVQRYGVSMLHYSNAAMRRAARNLSGALNAADAQSEAGREAISHHMAIVEMLLSIGANPQTAQSAVEKYTRKDLCAEAQAQIDACAQAQHARQLARLMPDGAMTWQQAMNPQVYRDALLPTLSGCYEGFAHHAARHRILLDMMQRGLLPWPDRASWEEKSPAGVRLVDMALASGQMQTLLEPSVWAGKITALRALLSVIDEKEIGEDARSALLHKVQLETLEAQRRSSKGRFKL